MGRSISACTNLKTNIRFYALRLAYHTQKTLHARSKCVQRSVLRSSFCVSGSVFNLYPRLKFKKASRIQNILKIGQSLGYTISKDIGISKVRFFQIKTIFPILMHGPVRRGRMKEIFSMRKIGTWMYGVYEYWVLRMQCQVNNEARKRREHQCKLAIR